MHNTVVVILGVLLGLLTNPTHALDLTLNTCRNCGRDFRKWPRLVYNDYYLCKGKLSFEFKTFVESAVMLYQDDRGKSEDYLAIELQDGHIQMKSALGGKIVLSSFKTTKTYNDFEWHSVGVELNGPKPCIKLTVDHQVVYSSEFDANGGCAFTSGLYIGGLQEVAFNSISYSGILRR